MNTLGPIGEKIAQTHLEDLGYEFIEANFRTRFGEIDLIMKDREGLVFVEVKTRRQGNPITTNIELPEHKIESLQNVINEYLEIHPADEWRAELAAVTIFPNGLAKIQLIEF